MKAVLFLLMLSLFLPVQQETDLPILDTRAQIEMWGYGVPMAVHWSGDSVVMLTSAGILIYDAANLEAEPTFLPPQSGAYTSLATHPTDSNRLLAADNAGGLWLWSIAQHEVTFVDSLEAPAAGVRYSVDGDQMMAGAGDWYYLWDTETGERKHIPMPASSVVSPDGMTIVVKETPVKVWDISGDEPTFTEAPSPEVDFTPLEMSPDQRLIVGGDSSGYIYVWSLETGAVVTHEPLEPDTPNTPSVRDALFLPDGHLLTSDRFFWGGAGIYVWTPYDMSQPLQSLNVRHYGDIFSMALSPDKRYIAAIASNHIVGQSLQS